MKKTAMALVAMAGCGDASDLVRTRSAYDFRCPADKVSIVRLSDSTYGADGCGQRTTYLLKCPKGALVESECDLLRDPGPKP